MDQPRSHAARTGDFIVAAAKALNIGTERIQRLVIDADILGGPVKVYVKVLPPAEIGEALADAIATGDGVRVVEVPELALGGLRVNPAAEATPIERRILAEQKRMLDILERIVPKSTSSGVV